MKKTEFLVRVKRYDKIRGWVLLVALAWVFVCMAAIFVVLTKYEEQFGRNLIQILGVLAIMGLAFFILMYEKAACKKAGLVCPICGVVMTRYNVEIVICSRNCPHCGGKIIEDD